MSFTEKRRQQFLIEDYYQHLLEYNLQSIKLFIESDAFEDDDYNCGESGRWELISSIYLDLLILNYTAGKSIDTLSIFFDNFINALNNKANAIAKFENSSKPGLLIGEGGFIALRTISLSILLNRNDLMHNITELINGEDREQSGEDRTINKFLKLIDKTYPDNFRDGVYSLNYAPLAEVIDSVLINKNKKEAEKTLNNYLSDWYSFHKQSLWHNSHLDLTNSVFYTGYWAFEAAALVYLLDLEDEAFYKYLYYPKDIVQWIRKQNTEINKATNTQVRIVLAGHQCPKSGC